LFFYRHVHLELCQIARELNVIFGPQLIMKIVVYFVYMTKLCYYIIMHVRTKGHLLFTSFSWFNASFWVMLQLARLFCLNYVCENVSAKVNSRKFQSCKYIYIYLNIYLFIYSLLFYFVFICLLIINYHDFRLTK